MEDQSIISPHNLLTNLIMTQKNKEKKQNIWENSPF